MKILKEKKEIHLENSSLDELCKQVLSIRDNDEFSEFKIMIDGTDEKTDFERGLSIPE